MFESKKQYFSPLFYPGYHLPSDETRNGLQKNTIRIKPGNEDDLEEKLKLPARKFCSGSFYEGEYDCLGFAGKGSYTYPYTGVKYEGNFFDGQFEGEGSLIYPNGNKIAGQWRKGKLISYRFIFSDGGEVTQPWTYLAFPERRYNTERANDRLDPPGKETLTKDDSRAHKLQPQQYDTVDGIFDLYTKTVTDDRGELLRIVSETEETMIIEKYRKGVLEHVGYRPEFYELWTVGAGKDVENIATESQSSEKHVCSEETSFGTFTIPETCDLLEIEENGSSQYSAGKPEDIEPNADTG